MSIPVMQVNKEFRQTFVSSSKGDQMKWKMGLSFKYDYLFV